ncbi:MAG: DNA polymerase Y family protein, partial [Hyphomicrobiaceae bacterium]|nr:DNA polymerase Y family protein [Hyphomicrobiaceae bacterium]
GEDAVLQAMMVESHIPERAVRDVPFDAATVKNAHPMEGAKDPACAERPIRLFTRPEPVAVTAEVPDGPPAWFRWRRVSYRVARAEGPERIAPEWWRDDCSLKTRDYFRIEDEEGRRYWLYREGFYGTADPPDWFVHGVFA